MRHGIRSEIECLRRIEDLMMLVIALEDIPQGRGRSKVSIGPHVLSNKRSRSSSSSGAQGDLQPRTRPRLEDHNSTVCKVDGQGPASMDVYGTKSGHKRRRRDRRRKKQQDGDVKATAVHAENACIGAAVLADIGADNILPNASSETVALNLVTLIPPVMFAQGDVSYFIAIHLDP